MVILQFVNSDARPKIATVECSKESIPQIMQWYGAFFAGDRYYVTADGAKLKKDQNGELIEPIGCIPE